MGLLISGILSSLLYMKILEVITEPIKKELEEFDAFFKASLVDQFKSIKRINQYILKQKGKKIRPILVILAAKLVSESNADTIAAAGFLEMLHNATLIHDDVIDDTSERRGILSINAFWNNKTAVLIGDYMLSNSLQLAIKSKNFELLDIISVLGKELSAGEILQMDKSKTLDITEESYYTIIDKKTAVLFSSCARAGGITANATSEQITKLKELGTNLGLAFQIRDDIFDFQPQGILGKPTGNDLRENKITLPLIFALQKCSELKKKEITKLLKIKKKSKSQINTIIDFTIEYDGLEYATEKMQLFSNKAYEILMTFEDNSARKSLAQLIEYIMERKK